MNPLAIPHEVAGNYLFLFTFSIITLITNKPPEGFSNRSESCHGFVIEIPRLGSTLLPVMWNHRFLSQPCHLTTTVMSPEQYVSSERCTD